MESIFANRAPLEYLIQPELPSKAVVCLTGESESGKTTLACAWGRDLLARGHPVLILDRDKNPRDRICERFERLGISSGAEHLRIWDCEQKEDAPQPDDERIAAWVKRMVAKTCKAPLVIIDSLVSFFTGDEDENSAKDMRAVFNRFRELTKLGATVIPIHHPNRNGAPRGSSDFKPASDQSFLVSNRDRAGGRLLDAITLSCEKSRYGLSGSINYLYAGGKMVRVEERSGVRDLSSSRNESELLRELLKANPGILAGAFVEGARARGLLRKAARDFLSEGISGGWIECKKDGRKHHHFFLNKHDSEHAP